jgi:hypothetical protein
MRITNPLNTKIEGIKKTPYDISCSKLKSGLQRSVSNTVEAGVPGKEPEASSSPSRHPTLVLGSRCMRRAEPGHFQPLSTLQSRGVQQLRFFVGKDKMPLSSAAGNTCAKTLHTVKAQNMWKTSTQDATPTVSALPVLSDEKASDHWYTLVKWDDLPHWRQDNHYIQGYYRRDSGSILRSFGSLAYWHNETINIYSHLIPALLSLPCAVAVYKLLQPRYDQATKSDVTAFCCFFLGAALCLGMSATYHTISNHSPIVNQIGNQLDYVGIVLLITGSFVPCVYYGFWCAPTLQKVYWVMVNGPGSLI